MAIIPKEEGKTKPTVRYSILGLIIIAIILSLAAFFWPVQLPENFKEMILTGDERRLSELQLNSSVLQSPIFRELKSYGEFPIVVSEGGRSDPFSL